MKDQLAHLTECREFSQKDLEEVLGILERDPSFTNKLKRFGEECVSNGRFEALCIGFCEAGELAGEVAAFNLNLDYSNEWGLLTGIFAGGTYALQHVYRDAKKHLGRSPSFSDAFSWTATTESSCVGSATGTEYLAGKLLGVAAANPITGLNLAVRIGALIPAFLIGTAAMSGLTLRKKDEVGRFISGKNGLFVLEDELAREMRNNSKINQNPLSNIKLSKGRLRIYGDSSHLDIQEKEIPRTYRGEFDETRESLYLVRSPLVRYSPGDKKDLLEYIQGFVEKTGRSIIPVKNIFEHDNNH
jgi:hypothetical protein